jgi:DNA-3-methyladenine glycosylase
MRIDNRLNGRDLLGKGFYLAAPADGEPFSIIKKPRIGVHYAGRWANRLLRFYIKGNSFVSKP